MVGDDLELQQRTGLYRGMLVDVRVTGHRDRFGIEVEVISGGLGFPAFIDAALISDRWARTSKEEFPEMGLELKAIVSAFMPNGELRLDARSSVIRLWAEGESRPPSST